MMNTLSKPDLPAAAKKLTNAQSCTVGYWIPAIVAGFFVLDILFRLLPLDCFAFRPYEPLQRYAVPPSPFDRLSSVTVPRSYGDLANISNLPKFRVYHSQTATTDRFGFRNADKIFDGPQIAGVCIGDSFTVGYAVNDTETLAVQLSQLCGKPFYNAGAVNCLQEPLNLFKQLKFNRGFVIAEMAESSIPSISLVKGDTVEFSSTLSAKEQMKRILLGWKYPSTFRQFLAGLIHPLQNDVVLPNVAAKNVVIGELQDGQSMLFSSDILKRVTTTGKEPFLPARTLQKLIDMDREYKKLGYTYVVMIAPDKYSIYGPLLKQSSDLPRTPCRVLEVEKTLRANGITVVDVYDVLSREAAKRLERHEYMYWSDDVHWTPAAVRLVADQIMKTLNQMQDSDRPIQDSASLSQKLVDRFATK
jgi:hypothetical protein